MPENVQLERDYTITEPVARAIASQLLESHLLAGKTLPQSVDLALMITGIGEELTMQGAPELRMNLLDENFTLLNSGFFTSGEKTVVEHEERAQEGEGRTIRSRGGLTEVQFNYPEGSKYWWMLRQVTPHADFTIETYWIPRVVRKLMDLRGPVKASRGSMTRAEFLQKLCRRVPEIRFHCKQLTDIQPVENAKRGGKRHRKKAATTLGRINPITGEEEQTSSSLGRINPITGEEEQHSGARTVGLKGDGKSGLTVATQTMTSQQEEVATTALEVADRLKAGRIATEALIYAGIWESRLTASDSNTVAGGHVGVWQGQTSIWGNGADVVGMAESFLKGGKGFQSGGAIALAKTNSNPIDIAEKVEAGGTYRGETGYPGDQAALVEVNKIVQAGGGTGAGGSGEATAQYNFEIGTASEPHQDFWTGMNKLASDVNWELVVDGPDIYFDSDMTLIRNTPIDQIDREDANVADWSYDWDAHEVATNFQVELVCDEFAYRGADVLVMTGFGPASEGSTAGLPGRWLVGEVSRAPGDIIATLTLLQPTMPHKEPPAEAQSTANKELGQGESADGSHALPLQRQYMTPLGRTDDGVDIENAPDGAPVFSMTNGICTAIASDPSGFGPNYPVIEVTEGSRKGKCIYYGHVKSATVKQGDRVTAGQQIAVMGHEGDAASLGHGHIEIGFSDRGGNPLNHGGKTPEGEAMRAFIIWVCSTNGITVT